MMWSRSPSVTTNYHSTSPTTHPSTPQDHNNTILVNKIHQQLLLQQQLLQQHSPHSQSLTSRCQTLNANSFCTVINNMRERKHFQTQLKNCASHITHMTTKTLPHSPNFHTNEPYICSTPSWQCPPHHLLSSNHQTSLPRSNLCSHTTTHSTPPPQPRPQIYSHSQTQHHK